MTTHPYHQSAKSASEVGGVKKAQSHPLPPLPSTSLPELRSIPLSLSLSHFVRAASNALAGMKRQSATRASHPRSRRHQSHPGRARARSLARSPLILYRAEGLRHPRIPLLLLLHRRRQERVARPSVSFGRLTSTLPSPPPSLLPSVRPSVSLFGEIGDVERCSGGGLSGRQLARNATQASTLVAFRRP